jgi:hypothetical protein
MSPASKNPYIINNGNNSDTSDALLMYINYKRIWLEKSDKIIKDYYNNLPRSIAARLYRAYLWPKEVYWKDLSTVLAGISSDEILEAIMTAIVLYAREHLHHIIDSNQQVNCRQDIDNYCQSSKITLVPGISKTKAVSSQDLFNILTIIFKYKDYTYSQNDFDYDLGKQKNMIKKVVAGHDASLSGFNISSEDRE